MTFRDALVAAITRAIDETVAEFIGSQPQREPVTRITKRVRSKGKGPARARRSNGEIKGWRPDANARRVPKAILNSIGIKIEKGAKDKVAQRFGESSSWDVTKDGTVLKDGKPFAPEARAESRKGASGKDAGK